MTIGKITESLSCVKNLPSHREVFLKTGLAKFCRPKAKVGWQRGRHLAMLTLIQKAVVINTKSTFFEVSGDDLHGQG